MKSAWLQGGAVMLAALLFLSGCSAPASALPERAAEETTASSKEPVPAETDAPTTTTAGAAATAVSASSEFAGTYPTKGTTTRGTAAASRSTGKSTAAPSKPVSTPTPAGKAVVGYYPGWSAVTGFTPDKIQAEKLSHMHYAFAKIDPRSLQITLADPTTDRRNFEKIRQLKTRNKQLKTLISVGGWDYSGYFSDAASTAQSRERFASSCIAFIREHGFDGVDLDWEYPVSDGLAGNKSRPQDKQNFSLLLQELRRQLDKQGTADGRRYYLSIAAGADAGYWNKVEPVKIVSLLDHVFLMAYDMHGPWEPFSDLNAPLSAPAESSPQHKTSVDAAVSAYLRSGGTASKLVLGMPFYGYRYAGVSARNNGLYSRFSSSSSIRYDEAAGLAGSAAYRRYWHASAGVPYLYGKDTFISYEDPDSIASKVRLAKSRGLGGVGAWSLAHDPKGVLLDSAYRTLRAG